jgi:hypothetical protein
LLTGPLFSKEFIERKWKHGEERGEEKGKGKAFRTVPREGLSTKTNHNKQNDHSRDEGAASDPFVRSEPFQIELEHPIIAGDFNRELNASLGAVRVSESDNYIQH